MGLFPEAPKEDDTFQSQIRDKYPPGSKERAGADKIIEILKQAHAIFRGIMKNDDKARIKGEDDLKKMLRDMGVTDEVNLLALTSIVASFAAFTPPEVYGEDHNDW
jgi:hypothetical protein